MSEELKPCPFCGGAAKLYDNQEHPYIYRVACTDCKTAYGYSFSYSEKHTAIKTWNERIPDWQDEHKRLISELEKCRGEILELADQVKWLRHIWAQDKAELERCRDGKYALSGLVDRSRRQADYWRKRAKKAEAKDE